MPDEDDEGPWEPPEVVELPVDGSLDLHTFAPRDVLGVVEAYLELCRERGILSVRVIHGKGKGVQRAAIRTLLARLPYVSAFRDGGVGGGGFGATVVELTPP